MTVHLIVIAISIGGDYLYCLPRSDDLSGYDPSSTYRLSVDISFISRHRIGIAFHPVEFDSGSYSFKGNAYDFYYGFDLSSVFFETSPKLYLLMGGTYHPWHLEFAGETVQLPTGKVDFKDWGYLCGLEFSWPIKILDLRVGGYYYYLMSEHMDRLGFDDDDEKYLGCFAGVRIRI